MVVEGEAQGAAETIEGEGEGQQQGAETRTGTEIDGEYKPSPYDALATDLGWTPPDKYKGDPTKFKDAETFIREGRKIQRDSSAELKALRSQVDVIARTTASVAQQEIERRVSELTGQLEAAVEEGDTAKAFKISREIDQTQSAVPSNVPPPKSPTVAAWAAKNPWFESDPRATALAVDTSVRLAKAGYSEQQQLEAAEQEVRERYPHLFGQGQNGQQVLNGKPAATVMRPGGRSPAPKSGPKGFADLPPAAQKVANDMVARGVIKAETPEKAKELYAANYWKNADAAAAQGKA